MLCRAIAVTDWAFPRDRPNVRPRQSARVHGRTSSAAKWRVISGESVSDSVVIVHYFPYDTKSTISHTFSAGAEVRAIFAEPKLSSSFPLLLCGREGGWGWSRRK